MYWNTFLQSHLKVSDLIVSSVLFEIYSSIVNAFKLFCVNLDVKGQWNNWVGVNCKNNDCSTLKVQFFSYRDGKNY
jgi:hypothetical protein